MPEDALEVFMAMMTGKEEIYYLITRVIKKFEEESGQKLSLNTNRDNYTPIAKVLSVISNELPFTSETKAHQVYDQPDNEEGSELAYPYRKYDITGGQVRDVYMGLVKKPRPYIVDACYIYLYGVGREGFQKNPPENMQPAHIKDDHEPKEARRSIFKLGGTGSMLLVTMVLLASVVSGWILLFGHEQSVKNAWTSYRPSDKEIAHLCGIWKYQTGAPQTRGNEAHRYRRIATNLMQITYDGREFIMKRYGASIDHQGYVEFTSPGVLSIHSFVGKTAEGALTNPSHSLARLNPDENLMYAISSTWSFESDDKNDIIGARNIYTKIGEGGHLRELMNTPENAACHCRIVEWIKSDGSSERFNLTYDAIQSGSLEEHLDEESLILREPKSGVLLKDTL